MAIKEYTVNFSNNKANFINLLNETGFFTKIESDDDIGTITFYLDNSKVLELYIKSSNTAEITYYSRNASSLIGNNSGFTVASIQKMVITSKGFILGTENYGYNIFFGKTTSLYGDTGFGCVYCGSSDIAAGTSYKAAGITSTEITAALTVPAQNSPITVLTNAFTPKGTEYFNNIYFTSAREDGTIAGRIEIGGRVGYTNGRIVLMDN